MSDADGRLSAGPGPRGDEVLTFVVMGVSGSGKTTVGAALSMRLGVAFIDADTLHPPSNVQKMAAGQPLEDADRLPWLALVGRRLQHDRARGRGSVAACSALRRTYRDLLRAYAPDARFVLLSGSEELIKARVRERHAGLLPEALVGSQFEALEPLGADERGMTVDVSSTPDQIVDLILREL